MTPTPPAWLPLLLVAPFVGSFLGVVVVRYGDGRAVMFARSECDHCHATLDWRDLVPIVSWLALGRRCRHCGARLAVFFPLIEIASVVPVVWASTVLAGGPLVAAAVLGWALLALALIDWRTYRLPDALTFFLLVAGLTAAGLFDRANLAGHFIGAAVGFASFALFALLYRALRKRDGLGLGDAKLLAALGAWVCWEGIAVVIFLGAVMALVYVATRAVMGHRVRVSERIAFGPFLALAGWIVWLYGANSYSTG